MMLLRCYPKITDWIYQMSGQAPSFDYRFLPVYSFGFFVALAFLAAATDGVRKLRRKEKLGLMKGVEKEITIGEAPTITEVAFYFIFGFVVFFKLFGFYAYHRELVTGALQLNDYFLSLYGSWVGGIIGAAAFAGYYYYTQNKAKLPQPEKKKIWFYPSDSMGDLVVMGAILGVLGSSFFNFLEDPTAYNNFWKDPAGSLFSGLSIYGGLIFSTVGFLIYAYIRKFNVLHFFDALAPGVILANGIGRIGCQVSGDGDWGIINTLAKPGWLPEFLWRSNYAHNIADMGYAIPNCMEEHCMVLQQPVFPTPIYEFLMCFAIYLFLTAVSKRLTYKPGMILAFFMILIGTERLSIERIRDISSRELYHIFGLALRQSEVISIVLVVSGVVFAGYLYIKYKKHGRDTIIA